MNIITIGTDSIVVWVTVSAFTDNNATPHDIFYRLTVDGGAVPDSEFSAVYATGTADRPQTAALVMKVSIGAGTHTIRVQWAGDDEVTTREVDAGTQGSNGQMLIMEVDVPTAGGFAWTTFTQATGDRIIYVSATGNDANDGLSTSTPKQSIAAGMGLLRTGFADWCLLKKGDTFSASIDWKISGRSTAQRMRLGTYGTGARPIVKTGDSPGISAQGGGGTPTVMSFLVFEGIDFYCSVRDPASGDFINPPPNSTTAGLSWLRGTTDVIVEDCAFRFFQVGISFNDSIDFLGMPGIQIRRCLITDNYAGTDAAHAQGTYMDGTDGHIFEECVFVRNGWNATVAGAIKTVFNHNCYFQHTCKNPVLKNCVVLEGSSHGVQMRPGGSCTGNIFAQNAIGILVSQDIADHPLEAMLCDGNLVTESDDINSVDVRAWGIDMSSTVVSAVVANNIVVHAIGAAPSNAVVDVGGLAAYSNNVIFDWSPGPDSNSLPTTPGPWIDPTVTLGKYALAHGGSNSFASFCALVRGQSRENWNDALGAQAVIAYFRAGYTLA